MSQTEQRGTPVNHPSHYNANPSGIEAIDVIEHMSFNLGNAVKYCWRADQKGKQIEDLKKAIWYIEREIQRLHSLEVPKQVKYGIRLPRDADVGVRHTRWAVEATPTEAPTAKDY